VADEQRHVREAVQLGASWEAASQAMAKLGYSCQNVAVDAATTNFTFSDCSKTIGGVPEFHACLMRRDGRISEIRYGLRPSC
jgi:hypothetical protein